jgi:hypothetical protein
MATYFQGAVKSGEGPSEVAAGTGYAVFSQTGINANVTGLTQDISFTLPKNSQIIAFFIDVLTAYDSATSATLSIGTASAGTQYVGSVNAKTAGRAAPTLSAAQLLAMASITTNTTVVATVTSVGQPTAGSVRVTVQYVVTQ